MKNIGAADVKKKQLPAEFSREYMTERPSFEAKRSSPSGPQGGLNLFQFCSFVALCFCCLMISPLGNVDKGQHYCKADEWGDTAILTVLVFVSLTAVLSVH